MKFPNYILAVLALMVGALQSCEKDVANFDLSTTSMLVTTAFISPQDTILAVEVSRTQPAIGKKLSPEELRVTNAAVTLSDGSESVVLTYNAERNRYYAEVATLPIVEGKTYFLKVTTPAGEKAEGTCTVPSRNGVRITELNYDVVPVVNYGYSMLTHKINFKWQDAPGVENYYHLVGYRSYNIMYEYPPQRVTYHEPAYADHFKIYVADTKQDGSIFHSPELSFSSPDPDQAPRPFGVYALLSVTDKAYYQYHQSVLAQEQNGGNPFAEPQRIYSNIQGGIGVFAAYNQLKALKIIQ